MITFLPYSNFDKVAQCLDRQRLGKQRLEALQILNIINDPTKGYQHHPAIKMWRAYPYTLARYGHTMCLQWQQRGYIDNLLPQFNNYLATLPVNQLPTWLQSNTHENRLLITTHRANLLRKDPQFYSNWRHLDPTMPYYWPIYRVLRVK